MTDRINPYEKFDEFLNMFYRIPVMQDDGQTVTRYCLEQTLIFELHFDTELEYINESDTFEINKNLLVLRPDFIWDGSSGPAIDTDSCMLASALHDALCEAIKETYNNDKITYEKAKSVLDFANRVYRLVCRANGMGWFRSWYQWFILQRCCAKFIGLSEK